MKKLISKFVIPECFYRESSGFTLIEIIVVLIIVGILASIAIPNLFRNVTKSRAAEALGIVSSWRPDMEACLQRYVGAEANCATTGSNPVAAPTPSACFFYAVSTAPTNGQAMNYAIQATGLAACGMGAGDIITLTHPPGATAAVTCVGQGALASAC